MTNAAAINTWRSLSLVGEALCHQKLHALSLNLSEDDESASVPVAVPAHAVPVQTVTCFLHYH